MPLRLYPDVRASGVVPDTWLPIRGGTIKFSVRNRAVLRELRRLRSGRWKKVIRVGMAGEVHYFEHQSGNVVGVKFLPRLEER
jgi:hypothetical protein